MLPTSSLTAPASCQASQQIPAAPPVPQAAAVGQTALQEVEAAGAAAKASAVTEVEGNQLFTGALCIDFTAGQELEVRGWPWWGRCLHVTG